VIRRLLELIEPDFEASTWSAFRLLVLEERPTPEVAATLGLTPNAVRIARSRVPARLRKEAEGPIDRPGAGFLKRSRREAPLTGGSRRRPGRSGGDPRGAETNRWRSRSNAPVARCCACPTSRGARRCAARRVRPSPRSTAPPRRRPFLPRSNRPR